MFEENNGVSGQNWPLLAMNSNDKNLKGEYLQYLNSLLQLPMTTDDQYNLLVRAPLIY
jgi:hypothetical protein